MPKKLHTKRLVSFLCAAISLTVLIVSSTIRQVVLDSIKVTLDYEPLYYIIITLSLLIGLYYTFYFAKTSKPKELKLLFKIFGPLFDPPANTLAYGIILSSVLRLVKGLFNQFFYNIEYFKEFDVINVSAIALACIPLLIWSVNSLVRYFVVIFIIAGDEVGEVTGITKETEEKED